MSRKRSCSEHTEEPAGWQQDTPAQPGTLSWHGMVGLSEAPAGPEPQQQLVAQELVFPSCKL